MKLSENAHVQYVLRLGDNALILGQRLAEWCGHSPFVEEDVAMANIALDHIGRARLLLSHAGALEGKGQTEDDLAFKRGEREYTNLLLCELPRGDFAFTVVRQVLLDTYNKLLYARLIESSDETLAAIAAKIVKEVSYHQRHSSQWIIRLGDGTQESRQRVQNALDEQWRFVGELFAYDEVDDYALSNKIGPDPRDIERDWREGIGQILTTATVTQPEDKPLAASGRTGLHTEHMGFLLAEMQSVQHAYPGLTW